MQPSSLILASTSRYRKRLLERLDLPFRTVAPGVPETANPDEAPADLALRLSEAKASAVSERYPEALVIGSDQVASLDGRRLGKPGTDVNARKQLLACRGRSVFFYTGICLVRSGSLCESACAKTEVVFRDLSEAQIADYVTREQPLDCAGSFRWEALGIALFRTLRCDDPTALEGLPLIQLTSMLEAQGLHILNTTADS